MQAYQHLPSSMKLDMLLVTYQKALVVALDEVLYVDQVEHFSPMAAF